MGLEQDSAEKLIQPILSSTGFWRLPNNAVCPPKRLGRKFPDDLPGEIPVDSDLFSRRFREGLSFLNFVERSILKLPLSKLCAVPLALQNRALLERGKRATRPRN